jgi:hypothetical protein
MKKFLFTAGFLLLCLIAYPQNDLEISKAETSVTNSGKGEIALKITGGTPPYIVYCSNGERVTLNNNEYTFKNLSTTITYFVAIVDANDKAIMKKDISFQFRNSDYEKK